MSTPDPIEIPFEEGIKKAEFGDVLAFGGNSPFSKIIKAVTRSAVSHVSFCAPPNIVEATGSGIMESALRDCASYDGRIWLLKLRHYYHGLMRKDAMAHFVQNSKGIAYDMPQAIRSALDLLPQGQNHEDLGTLFCSEFVAAAFEEGRIIKDVNCSEVTPIDLCRFGIYEGEYYQLKGEKKKIYGFNRRAFEGFGY